MLSKKACFFLSVIYLIPYLSLAQQTAVELNGYAVIKAEHATIPYKTAADANDAFSQSLPAGFSQHFSMPIWDVNNETLAAPMSIPVRKTAPSKEESFSLKSRDVEYGSRGKGSGKVSAVRVNKSCENSPRGSVGLEVIPTVKVSSLKEERGTKQGIHGSFDGTSPSFDSGHGDKNLGLNSVVDITPSATSVSNELSGDCSVLSNTGLLSPQLDASVYNSVVSCRNQFESFDNTFYQAFDLESVSGQYTITSVEVGVELFKPLESFDQVEMPVDMGVALYSRNIDPTGLETEQPPWYGDLTELELVDSVSYTYSGTAQEDFTISIPMNVTMNVPNVLEDNLVLAFSVSSLLGQGVINLASTSINEPNTYLTSSYCGAFTPTDIGLLGVGAPINWNLAVNISGCELCEELNECGSCAADLYCSGCTNDAACNYDPLAVVDDGSCLEGDEYQIQIALDQFPEETTWQILDSNADIVASYGPYGFGSLFDSLAVHDFCLPSGCYELTVFDSYGDGICCDYGQGSYNLLLNDEVIITSGGNFLTEESTSWCSDSVEELVGGCTDLAACNYNEAADYDDSSCYYAPLNSIEPGSCVCPDDMELYQIFCGGGLWPEEVSWSIQNQNGDSLAFGGAPSLSSVCLNPDECYSVVMLDSWGDGWSGNTLRLLSSTGDETELTMYAGLAATETFGECIVECNNTLVNVSVINGENTDFGFNISSGGTSVIQGNGSYSGQACFNLNACYDVMMSSAGGNGPLSQVELQIGESTYTWADGESTNNVWASFLTEAYGTCGGCIDESACNYDELADIDDGSCVYDCDGCEDYAAFIPEFAVSNDGDTIYLAPCINSETFINNPASYWQTFDIDASFGEYTILSMDILSGYHFIIDNNGQFAPLDLDVDLNVYANLTGDSFDGTTGNYELVGTTAVTFAAGDFLNTYTVPLGETIDVIPGGVDDVVVEITPVVADSVWWRFLPFQSVAGSSVWITSEGCGDVLINDLGWYSSDVAFALELNGCEDCSTVDECGVCDGDGTTCIPGCTDPEACNYSDEAGLDDGSCDYGCYGCTNEFACNYDSTATFPDNSCDLSCAGCLNVSSIPYLLTGPLQSPPVYFSGACPVSFEGVPFTGSYDIYQPLHVESETGEYTMLRLYMALMEAYATDLAGNAIPFSADLDISIYTHEGGEWSGDMSALNLVHNDIMSVSTISNPQWVSADIDATFDVPDTEEDNVVVQISVPNGLSNGSFGTIVFGSDPNLDVPTSTYLTSADCGLDSPVLASSVDGLTNESVNFILYNYGCVDCSTVDDCLVCAGDGSFCADGCTNDLACNYSSVATEDDGSCEFSSCYGCTNPTACNYDEDMLFDDGSCDNETALITIDISFDNYPLETTWSLSDEDGDVVWSGGPHGIDEAAFTESICLAEGCYSFSIYDSWGDGICCEWGSGNYAVTLNGIVVASGGDFQDEETTLFCTYIIEGCTDPAYCNYNIYATIDDGSCSNAGSRMLTVTGETELGWTESFSSLYSSGPWRILDESGSTVLQEAAPSAPSFSVLDTLSTVLCPGCYSWECIPEYQGAIDYLKLEVDGFGMTMSHPWLETQEICLWRAGCTYESALNFDLEAAMDDGTCVFEAQANTCPQDINGDGEVTVSDLLDLLGAFGVPCSE